MEENLKQKGIDMDYFYDNKRKTTKKKLNKYWMSFVFKWQREKKR